MEHDTKPSQLNRAASLAPRNPARRLLGPLGCAALLTVAAVARADDPSPVVGDTPAAAAEPQSPAAVPAGPPALAQPQVIAQPQSPAHAPAPPVQAATPAPPALADQPVIAPGTRARIVGFQFDAGFPDGLALGVSVRPWQWLRLGAAVTYNALAFGLRAGATFDPLPGPVSPSVTVEGGHAWSGKVPGGASMPSVGDDYVDLHGGVEFGARSRLRFFVHGGGSWIAADVNGVRASGSGAAIAGLSYHGWIAPSAKMGISVYF